LINFYDYKNQKAHQKSLTNPHQETVKIKYDQILHQIKSHMPFKSCQKLIILININPVAVFHLFVLKNPSKSRIRKIRNKFLLSRGFFGKCLVLFGVDFEPIFDLY
jgi:hypothetical protein